MKTLLQLLEDYIEHGRTIGMSPVHLRVQRYSVRRTLSWFKDAASIERPDQLTRAGLSGWFRSVNAKRTGKGLPLKPRSIAKQIAADRSFIAWLEKRGLVPVGLHDELPQIKLPRILPTSVLTHEQMLKLIATVDTTSPWGSQLRAALETLYSSGVRISELLGMDIDTIDLASGTARVSGKGNKERVVPVGRTALRHVEGHLKATRPMMVSDRSERALWVNSAGRRLPYYTFRRQLLTVARDAKLPLEVTAHTFRRSCTTELIRNGADLWLVKELLGHEVLDTLDPYVRLTIVDLKKTHARCHPRERDRK